MIDQWGTLHGYEQNRTCRWHDAQTIKEKRGNKGRYRRIRRVDIFDDGACSLPTDTFQVEECNKIKPKAIGRDERPFVFSR